jgi:hypothetical protein
MRFTASAVGLSLLVTVGCTKSPTDPSGGSTVFQGQTVSAIDGSPSPNLSVRVGTQNVTTDGTGLFEVDLGETGNYRVLVRGGDIVERETHVNGPSGTRTRLSVIPASFDLTAFNEMFRTLNSRLARWTSRPTLVILATVMDYRGASDTYEASGEQMSDDEVAQMLLHYTEGLALLTGNNYTTFADVEIERPAAGARVSPFRAGKIVVGRYTGIATFARTIGYGQWGEMPDGTIASGANFLDRDFDKNDSRRRLLRIHELGHALGYQHVESRVSIMNPAVGPEPNDFDRAGAMIAFQRPVGNRAPDVDPGSSTGLFVSTGQPRWSAPTVCR